MTQDRVALVNNSAPNSLFDPNPQISAKMNINISLAAADAAAILAVGYPMGFNSNTGKHAPWMAPDATILTVSLVSSTSGTFTVTVNGQVTATIAYDATAAEVEAAIKAIGYDVSDVLTSEVHVITFDAQSEIEVIPTVTGDVTSITGGSPTAVETAGTSTFGTNKIVGFINPNPTQVGTEAGNITLSRVTTLATGVTVNPHNLVTGMILAISGATDSNFDDATATITVTSPTTFTYAVADTGAVTDAAAYTTTNPTMAIMMTEGDISASVPQALVATADVTALNVALKDNLVVRSIYVQGLAGVN